MKHKKDWKKILDESYKRESKRILTERQLNRINKNSDKKS